MGCVDRLPIITAAVTSSSLTVVRPYTFTQITLYSIYSTLFILSTPCPEKRPRVFPKQI